MYRRVLYCCIDKFAVELSYKLFNGLQKYRYTMAVCNQLEMQAKLHFNAFYSQYRPQANIVLKRCCSILHHPDDEYHFCM